MDINVIISAARQNAAQFKNYRLPGKMASFPPELLKKEITVLIATEVELRHHSFDFNEALECTTESLTNWLAQSNKSGLILYGPMGTGKSTALKAMWRLFRRYADSCAIEYISATDIHCAAQCGDITKLSHFTKVGYLFIDDIGHEPVRCMNYGVDLAPIEDIICHRYENMRTTLFTTNLGDLELANRYGDRMAERIKEEYDTILFNGKNYRRL